MKAVCGSHTLLRISSPIPCSLYWPRCAGIKTLSPLTAESSPPAHVSVNVPARIVRQWNESVPAVLSHMPSTRR